jgi:hypothetical protein
VMDRIETKTHRLDVAPRGMGVGRRAARKTLRVDIKLAARGYRMIGEES